MTEDGPMDVNSREAALWSETMRLKSENEFLRNAVEAIKQATIAGRVCDDVAWFDMITTLHDYCDQTLHAGRAPGE